MWVHYIFCFILPFLTFCAVSFMWNARNSARFFCTRNHRKKNDKIPQEWCKVFNCINFTQRCRKSMLIEFMHTFSKVSGNFHKTFWGISKSLFLFNYILIISLNHKLNFTKVIRIFFKLHKFYPIWLYVANWIR